MSDDKEPAGTPLWKIAEQQREASAREDEGGEGTTDPGTSDVARGAGGTTKGVVGAGGGSGVNASELDDTTSGLGPGE